MDEILNLIESVSEGFPSYSYGERTSWQTSETCKFGEFIFPAEVALVYLKFVLSFIKFCSLVTELWLIC